MGNSRRRVFMTFLGTNDYTACNYILAGDRVDGVKFIQEALVRLVCNEFGADDRVVVFLTSGARDKNWPELQEKLVACGKAALVRDIDIPEGRSEDELWHIFSVVVDQLEQGDRVILDITHGFRSLPMLGMVLLPYARLLKGIEVDGIYYGAFEVLGPAFKVKEMPMAERNAPVFDLTSFADLLDWTAAVQEFVRHGNPAGIADLLKGEAGPRLGASRGNDPEARAWRDLGNCLAAIAGQITTGRGAEIVDGRYFGHLKDRVAECSEIEVPPPFRPLLDRIAEKAAPFGRDQAANCLAAVRWCMEHDLVQQGLTMLQEGVVTVLAERFGLDWGREEDRDLVSDAIHVLNQKRSREEWKQLLQERPEVVERIHADTLVRDLAPVFARLSEARNDINHGGFLQETRKKAVEAPKLAGSLESCFRGVEKILGNVADVGG